jgi:tetratricopeptide (TPR) repeat protein
MSIGLIMDRRQVFILQVFLCFSGVVCAERSLEVHEYFSPFNAKTFHKIGYELYAHSERNEDKDSQAILFMDASTQFDYRSKYAFVDMINLGSEFKEIDYSMPLRRLMNNYLDDKVDLVVVARAVRYVLDRMDSREQREAMLGRFYNNYKAKNSFFASEVLTELALLVAEKSDISTAMNYLTIAYKENPYNKMAFLKLRQFAQLQGEPANDAIVAKYLRTALTINPMDINAAMEFAEFLEKLALYSMASSAYEYCADLFMYLYPGEDLPASIYLPWSISSYNTIRGRAKCIEIARQVRQSGGFDLILEAIAANAALKRGDIEGSTEFFKAGAQAERILTDNPDDPRVSPEQIAWFYAFASPNLAKSLEWSERAFLEHPDSIDAKAVYGYALVINGQEELAADILRDIYKNDQIASVAYSMVELIRQNTEVAIDNLKSAVEMAPGSLAGETAKILLQENGSDYIQTTNSEIVFQSIRNDYKENAVPKFITPDELFVAKLNLGGSEFDYEKDFDVSLVITNNSNSPIIINDEAMLKGNIRVDARVTGDMEMAFPKLISKKIQPSFAIEPGRYASFPLDPITGPLRKLLLAHPQASFNIEFTLFLDPVEGANGSVRNSLYNIEPYRIEVVRSAEKLNRNFIMQRIDVLSKGQMKQKLSTAQLFAGLLMEQYALEDTTVSYKRVNVGRVLIIDVLRKSLADKDWTVKIQTMAMILEFPKPLDYELLAAVSENLGDDNWSVRMMSLFILSKFQGDSFKGVLDWTVRYDPNRNVQNMAIVLGGDKPEVEQ